jgi:hypothetical protein
VFISVAEERAAGVYNSNAKECCVPLSIQMTKSGASPFVKKNNSKIGEDPAVYENPWLGRRKAGEDPSQLRVGDILGGSINLEWIITFNTDPRKCHWGRSVVRWRQQTDIYDDVWEWATIEKGKVVINYTWWADRHPLRDDTDHQNEYIIGHKVYMYDAPGGILLSMKRLFDVWATSEDGTKTIEHWSYVDTSTEYYQIDRPIFRRKKPFMVSPGYI